MFNIQIEQTNIEVYMQEHKFEIAETFEYLGSTWTSKLFLRSQSRKN